MRIPAAVFASSILLFSLSALAQATPENATQNSPCGALPKAPDKDGILSDTHGVDFEPYIGRIRQITQSSWKPLVPKEAEAPVFKTGEVVICFKILPSGHLMGKGMVLEGRSGDSALDRAAWGAITTSVFPPLPAEFKEPCLTVRFHFSYNPDRRPPASRKTPKARNSLGPLGITLGYGTKL